MDIHDHNTANLAPLLISILYGISILYSVSGQYNFPSNEWGGFSNILSSGNGNMAVGYDNTTDTIYILGGISFYLGSDNRYLLLSYNNGVITNEGNNYFSLSIYGGSNAFTQIGPYLYVHNKNTAAIHRFNLQTKEMNYSYMSSPINSYSGSCFTSFIHDDITYLALVGAGTADLFGISSVVQIYNFESDSWLNNVPSLQIARGSFTCNYIHNKLWAIGGCTECDGLDRTNNIEILDVSSISSISTQQWTYNDYHLPLALGDHKSVVLGDVIVVIGGVHGSGWSRPYSQYIFTINAITGFVKLDGEIDIAMGETTAIVANNVLYLFGGITGSSNSDALRSYRYIDTVPTPSPTPSPTLATPPPTLTPTLKPTSPPTLIPTSPPTLTPTLTSHSPTLATAPPTTDSPTAAPTVASVRARNVTSNYAIHSTFGNDLFDLRFAAAIGQCMNEYLGSSTYIKYECMSVDSAVRHTYSNNNCTAIIAGEDTYPDEFVCSAAGEDTFIELHVFPADSTATCPGSEKSVLFIADSVCTLQTSNESDLYSAYCQHYEQDSSFENEVWLQYFDADRDESQCNRFSFVEDSYFSSENGGTCSQQFNNVINMKMVRCYTAPEAVLNGDEGARVTPYDFTGYVVLVMVLFIPLLCCVIAFLFHRKRAGSDLPAYVSLFKFSTGVGDLYTDAIWSLALYGEGHPLWPLAVCFSFGPHVLSIMVGLAYITKWRQTSSVHISEFAKSYDKIIIIFTLLSGFYSTMEMITSHLFHLDGLSLQIRSKQRSIIQNLKIINNVILENVPCLAIQLIYLSSATTTSSITILAMSFSIVTIIFNALTIAIRICNGCIELKKQENIRIYFDFILVGTHTGIIKNYHIHTAYLLSESIALALHIQLQQVEIIYIHGISDGIKVKVELQYLDRNNKKVILKELRDKAELYQNMHKEITNKLKLESANNVKLSIHNVTEKEFDENLDTHTNHASEGDIQIN